MEEQNKSETAKKEEEILKFWQENRFFEESVINPPRSFWQKLFPPKEFVFYDGPPFATGLPHYGHILASTIKDAIPRYKTMRGHKVLRKWGWDCHGLPIENIVEKELKISGKKQIEEIGIEKFNETARSKVETYVSEWKKTVDRIGRWVDFDGSYKTIDNTFIESVWWGLKELWKKGKIYESTKVLMYCPRCETPVANSEVAMDGSYKDITDISVYVALELKEEKGTYLIAWTTTPWTLPGNVALAFGREIDYSKILIESGEFQNKHIILANSRIPSVLRDVQYKIVRTFKGETMEGKSYEPIFPYYIDSKLPNIENAWKIYLGDFVTEIDGTGIVHIAPAFGEDDMKLARERKLPVIHHVGTTGKFNKEVKDFDGIPVKPKEDHQSGDVAIIKWLFANKKLFQKEKIVHSYPHCFRCETPLYYYALPSWFIKISDSKSQMLSENKGINWIPKHLKEGRFQNIMEGAPDWNISRNRYWASPLPIWKSDKTNEVCFLGSLKELKEKTRRNEYFVMRHGEGEHNVNNTISSKVSSPHHLTEDGKIKVAETAKKLRQYGITKIIASPFIRTMETASIVAEIIGIKNEDILTDERLREFDFGILDGKVLNEYRKLESELWNDFDKRLDGGESINDMRQRVGKALFDTDKLFKGERILFVTHEAPARAIFSISEGLRREDIVLARLGEDFLKTGDFQKIDFAEIPHNKYFELDYHRPYIDEIKLKDKEGNEMKRVLEVLDCWFESSAMPFASIHYPFENKDFFIKHFPADFISEYIAQTRTWFYYTHALGILVFGKKAFKNVIATGTVLAEDGHKMSKSKGNFPDPWIIFNKYGVDSLRIYLLSSPLMKSEDLNFSEKDVDGVHKKIILRLKNVLSFYLLFKDDSVLANNKSENVLDQWIISRLSELMRGITLGLEKYEIDEALRGLSLFVDDLSAWYVRRNRDRVKEGDSSAKATLKFVLKELAKVLAPFAPFVADEIFGNVRSDLDPQTVHLCEWPKFGRVKKDIIQKMKEVREIASVGLEHRIKLGFKVKQPLQSITLNKNNKLGELYEEILKDELNIKEVKYDINQSDIVVLDQNITEDLKVEGAVRELLREIQDLRKSNNLQPQDKVSIVIKSDVRNFQKIEDHKAFLQEKTNSDITFSKGLEDNIDHVNTVIGNFSINLLSDVSSPHN